MKKLCVIGWPVAHSRSPLVHNYWIRKYGLDGHYEKTPVEPADLATFVESFRTQGFNGCNVTVPHKENIMSLLAHVDEHAKRLGAVNTIYTRDGELHGTNTDGEGFCAHLLKTHPSFQITGTRVIIIGAGGAAKAIIGSLLDQGVEEISIINRSTERANKIQQQFGPKIKYSGTEYDQAAMEKCDLFINSTSLGMQYQPPLDIELQLLNPRAIVADIVYTPLETELLKRAKVKGNPTLGGLGMLLYQAVRGFELWFDIKPEVSAELYDLVAADLMKARS